MKKFIFFLVLLVALVAPISLMAEQHVLTEEQYQALPKETREKLSLEQTVNRYGEYAGLGKEIGIAINESLKAIEGSAQRISETELGKTAITIVVWKVLYKDVLGVLVGAVLLTFCFILTFKAVRNKKNEEDEEHYEVHMVIMCIAAVACFIASFCCLFGS